MAEYIDKNFLMESLNKLSAGQYELRTIKLLVALHPTADVVEVKHGKWFLLDDCSNAGVYCSVCRKKVYREKYANQKLLSKYCPNCGAKMEVEHNER